ncbi:MAG TPA: hydrogenase iron-sulfur subunit [Anaerolineaceae bacterium]|nr:hydrogenase iron-sulfur subunit [Anaerolineaceae bacterium]
MPIDPTFEPTIIGFTCYLCSNHGANMKGIKQLRHPANVRLVRMLCSARMEPDHFLKAFASGADGIVITGCHPGNTHYAEQKSKMLRRYSLMQRLLVQMGIEPERLRLVWQIAGEASRLAEEMDRLIEDVNRLGPLERPASQQAKKVLDVTQLQHA